MSKAVPFVTSQNKSTKALHKKGADVSMPKKVKKYASGGPATQNTDTADHASAGVDSVYRGMPNTPKSEAFKSNLSKSTERNMGPNIVSRPEDYKKGGVVRKKK